MADYSGLKTKAVRGVAWSAIQKFAVTFLTFVSEIVLARLLMPYDFGCIEMLAIFMLLAETLVGGGFGSALIQKKNPTQDDYSTIFFWNMGVAVLLYVVLYFCAPAIARFYGIPNLCPILRVQSLVLFVYAFNIIQTSQLKKQLRFKEIATASVIASVVSLATTITIAYLGCGVWSLVAKNLVLAVIVSIISEYYTKWKPTFAFSWSSFKELFSFGFFMLLSNLVTSFSSKIQGLLIGKIYSPTTMGYYSKASGTEGVVSNTISQVMDQVTYPLYAELQDDMPALRATLKRLIVSLAFVIFPIVCLFILIAKPMFVILYSEKWVTSVPYFQVLCIGGFASCLQSVNFHSISAIGKSKVTFKWTMIKRTLGIGFVVGGLALWGMKGILCGAVLNAWFAYFVNMGLVSKHIGYKWNRQLLDLAPIALVTAICFGTAFGIAYVLHLNMYLDGLVKAIIFSGLFVTWVVVAKPQAFTDLKNMSRPLLRKLKK